MISFFIGEFVFPPEGLVIHNIKNTSFRLYPYTTSGDKIR